MGVLATPRFPTSDRQIGSLATARVQLSSTKPASLPPNSKGLIKSPGPWLNTSDRISGTVAIAGLAEIMAYVFAFVFASCSRNPPSALVMAGSWRISSSSWESLSLPRFTLTSGCCRSDQDSGLKFLRAKIWAWTLPFSEALRS